jgi:hypothetical protein
VAGRKRWAWLGGHPLDERELSRRGISAVEEIERDDPLWPGQLAVLFALLLYLVLPPKLTVGPNWLLPSAEFVLFVSLVVAALGGAPPRNAAGRSRSASCSSSRWPTSSRWAS